MPTVNEFYYCWYKFRAALSHEREQHAKLERVAYNYNKFTKDIDKVQNTWMKMHK